MQAFAHGEIFVILMYRREARGALFDSSHRLIHDACFSCLQVQNYIPRFCFPSIFVVHTIFLVVPDFPAGLICQLKTNS